MEIHQLRYFKAVAECRSFTRAAKREHVSQPALSHQITKLEEELGAKLLNRKGRLVELTPCGEVFLPRIDFILQQLQDARTQILEMAEVESGKVTLGVIGTIAPFMLPDILRDFLKQHPRIELKVQEDSSGVLLAGLKEKTLDIALMPLPVSSDEMSCIELFQERLFAIVGPNHALQSESNVTLEQLAGVPFLLLKDGHCFRDDTLSAFRGANIKPQIVFESGCFLTILNMVKAGMGVSVMPEMAVDSTSGCKFIPINSDRPVRTIGLVQSRRQYQTPAHSLLVAFLRLHLRPARITRHI